MKTIASFISVGIACVSLCVADPAPPYETDILSDLGNLEVKADQWTLSKGILLPKSPTTRAGSLLLVKAAVVNVPRWYKFECELVEIHKQNGKFPEAGLVFGFIDKRNYWSLILAYELSDPLLKLVQVKDGKTVTETSVPLEIWASGRMVSIGVEVHHGGWVRVLAYNSRIMTHKVPAGIARGGIGLLLEKGSCGFSKARISGIAKN